MKDWDWSELGTKVDPETYLQQERKPKRRASRWCKLPDMWADVLCEKGASAADWAISSRLLRMARFAHDKVVALGNEKTAVLGFCPHTRRRVLKRLEAWSLIRLEQRPGATPRIHLKWMD